MSQHSTAKNDADLISQSMAFARRSLGLVRCLGLAMVFQGVLATSSRPDDAVAIPSFWSQKEILPKRNIGEVTRVRFLTTVDFPPLNFIDATGKLSGFNVDLVRAICAELQIAEKCEVQAVPWSEIENDLEEGDGEAIIAGLAVSPDSRAKYVFSRSYLQFPARFAASKRSGLAEPLVDALYGKRVGVVAGTSHERFLHDHFGSVSVVSYVSQEALLGDLGDAKIDAAFGDGMQFAGWLSSAVSQACCDFVGGPYLANDYFGKGLAIATMPRNAKLAAALDTALQRISAKGAFADLYLRYFPVSFY